MTTIRPNTLPPQPQPAGPDARRLAAQAFFALAGNRSQPATVTAEPAALQVMGAATAPRGATALDPNKIPRPGSLIDIRV